MRAFRMAALLAALTLAAPAEAQRKKSSNPEEAEKERIEEQRAALKKRDKVFPVKSTWVATSLNNKPFSGDRPSFTLDDQFRARGFVGCNTFSATAYPLREQRFAVGPLALTKKACDKAVMTTEQQFLVALRTSAQWDIVGSSLVIKTQNGELKFERGL